MGGSVGGHLGGHDDLLGGAGPAIIILVRFLVQALCAERPISTRKSVAVFGGVVIEDRGFVPVFDEITIDSQFPDIGQSISLRAEGVDAIGVEVIIHLVDCIDRLTSNGGREGGLNAHRG